MKIEDLKHLPVISDTPKKIRSSTFEPFEIAEISLNYGFRNKNLYYIVGLDEEKKYVLAKGSIGLDNFVRNPESIQIKSIASYDVVKKLR